MPNSRTINLSAASYRGIEFKVNTESQTTGGRRVIIHEYLNSDRVFIEDIGLIPPQFSVNAFVHGPDWINKKNELTIALEFEGPGTLILPVFGAITVYALPYSIDTSQTSVGIVSFRLNFAVTSLIAGPTAGPSTIEDTFGLGEDSRGLIETVFATIMKVPKTIENVTTMISDITDMASNIRSGFRNFMTSSALGQMLTTIDNLFLTLPNLINLPSQLASELTTGVSSSLGLWSNVASGILNDGDGYSPASEMLTAGSGLYNEQDYIRNDITSLTPASVGDFDVPIWGETTEDRIDRNDNRLLIVDHTRINALIMAYEQAAARDYDTTDEIRAVRSSLEIAHEQIMRIDVNDEDRLQSDLDLRDSIENVRISALNVLAQKEQESFGLTTVIYQTPVSALYIAYDLYSELFINIEQVESRAKVIRNLNPTQQADRMMGEITVIQT